MAVSARRAPVPRLRSCGRLVRTSSTTLVCSWPPHHAWSLGRRGRPGRRNPVTCRSPICGECVASAHPCLRNPAFGRVEGENGLAESPKRASEMSEGVEGPAPLRTRRPRCGDTAAKALPASWTHRGGGAMPRRPIHALPTDPRAAGDGVSSRVSSTAARFARMAATALSIAASSGGGGELRVVDAPPRTSPAMPPAGRPPLPAHRYAQPPSGFHTHTKTPDGG